MGNSIELKSVKDLLGMSFFIPNYQRGYRWEQTQVKDLLEDIWTFSKTRKEGEIYCIQPLVVSQKDEEDILKKCKEAKSLEDIRRYLRDLRGTWNVVDGQQRLTTIYLILCFMKIKDRYQIDYSTRKGSIDFLSKFGEEKTKSELIQEKYEDNIDFFFMYHAYEEIKSWFDNHDDDEKDKFKETLLTDVKFIWYHVASDQEIPVFKRLNIGKIPLTDSELIKALFLNRGNFSFGGKDVEYIQERIASEWDQIEYRLQDDEFWSFINNIDYEKPTRIDYILDLICEKNDLKIDNFEVKDLCNDSHKTFRYFFIAFNQKLKNTEDKLKTQCVEDIWKKIKYYFQVFEEWYHDYRLFHYVGYLTPISKPCKVSKLIDLYQRSSNKENFVEDIKSEIVEKLKAYSWLKNLNTEDDLKEYAFDQDDNASKQDCVCILLLHNIETIIQQNEKLVSESKYNLPNFTKFPFHLYKKENWQVEHIRPYSGDDLQDKDKQKIYLSLAKEYLPNEDDLIKKIDNFLSDKGNYDFSSILEELNKTGGDNQLSDDDKNQLWNFVLLDEATNKEYGNQIFPVKRAFVINKEKGNKVKYIWKNGKIDNNEEIKEIAFVPPCTKNVFTKNYTNMPSSMVNWTKEDAELYLKDILYTLKDYITKLTS